jgi:CRISPR-associated protein Cmr1
MRTWKKPEGWDASLDAKAPRQGGRATEQVIRLTCKLITPVMGGGVVPKKFDPQTPIRVPSIRGQLRFWWRATHRELSLEDLRERESKLFGGVHGKVAQPSAVTLHVLAQPGLPQKRPVFQDGDAFKLHLKASEALAYGAFPLRGLDAAKVHDVLWEYREPFTLELRFPAQHRGELERALWAWLHFGGLGARTRRGFGAVELVQTTDFQLESLEDGWRRLGTGQPQWPVLPAFGETRRWRRGNPLDKADAAHEQLLRLLRLIRQGEEGRTPRQPRPGRSFWPEPDALRRIYRITQGPHAKPIHDPHIDVFPRAAFGAPIIFHFKTERGGPPEPTDSTLVPATERGEPLGRFASRLILRPHAEGGRYRPLAVALDHPKPGSWALLERTRTKERKLRVELEPAEAARIKSLQVDGATYRDPIEAYLARLGRP